MQSDDEFTPSAGAYRDDAEIQASLTDLLDTHRPLQHGVVEIDALAVRQRQVGARQVSPAAANRPRSPAPKALRLPTL